MTDLEGSTRAWDASPKSARQALERHNEIVVEHVTGNRGQVVELGREGDGVLAVFSQATDAVATAFRIQRALQHGDWSAGADMNARIAIHTGEAELRSGHYLGAPLYRCGRLLGIAHGGQVVVSTATEEMVRDALSPELGLRDLGLHRLRDLSRPEHVYQLLHRELRADFPPLLSVAAPPRNVPHFLTTFINREVEIRALKPILARSRMVTLIGTGGAGKSRLAAELASATDEEWPDGVWWVELSAESGVAGAVVTNLELPGRGSPQQVVASWLASRHGLLILDNCEHLVAECAGFCQFLLERCPALTVLATSREAIGVPGEVRWAVGPLDGTHALDLFEARARLVLPGLKAVSREPVVAICNRLDRLPLAIEMAAARLDLMSERELLANLNDRFRVLGSAARTAPERQQTMAATIDWSYRLLTVEEAQLFRRLAVFQGGFTLEAARAVCAGGDSTDVLGGLTGLVRKSMVVADRVEDGSTRYRMLESHHDFAREKLVESGELDQMRGRHYEYFRAERWTSRDVANFWAAIAWAKENVEDGGLDLAIEVADAGHTDQARARVLLLELLGRAGVQGSARARALNLAARLTTRQADYVESRALADRSIAAARELKDPELLAQMLSGAGVVYHAANELDRAHLMYDEALTLLQTSPNRRLAIEVQNEAAVLLTEQGRHQEAVAMLEECLAFTRAEGDRATTAKYLESQANALLGLGDVDAAARNWRDALATFSELNDPFGTIWCMGGLALVASRRGEHENALRLAAVADRMSRQWSLSAWPLRIAQLEEAMKAARRQLGQKKAEVAWNEGAALPDARALEFGLGEGDVETAPAEYGPLSRREREVVAMVAAGMTNKEIASRLFIAERTAEGHVERIRNKLGVRSRTEVATWAVGHGITAAELDNRKPGSTV